MTTAPDIDFFTEPLPLDIARTSGNCKPSGFSEYDNLTGRVVRQYCVEWEDEQGNRWRKVCQVIDLGRPDRGIVVDPDAAIAYEPWEDGKPPSASRAANAPITAIEAHHANKEARHDALQAKIVAYLREHGATSAGDLAGVVGKGAGWLRIHLAEREHKAYKRVIVNSHIHLWEAQL